MKVAISGRNFNDNFSQVIYKIFEKLNKNKAEIIVYKQFYNYIEKKLFFKPKIHSLFVNADELKDIDIVFSIGGDGTFLECVALLKKKIFPIIGINSGRLGFLASISQNNIDTALRSIIKGDYEIEERTILEANIKGQQKIFNNFPYAINELTVQKKDTTSMINIDVYIDNLFLNTYWADGLIIATPTGSTAYSLSAGGPIVLPSTNNFVITPLAPHTLTVRPMIVPNTSVIKIVVNGRGKTFLAALDSRNAFIDFKTTIILKKADFKIKVAKIKSDDFFTTLREKLMWGLDIRN